MKTIKLENMDGTISVLEELKKQGIHLNSDCGGKGTCGKCKVFINKQPCLGCKTYIKGSVDISFSDNLTDKIKVETGIPIDTINTSPAGQSGRAICVDIGTTTLAAALVDLSSGEILSRATAINHQNAFGSDVISRIEASCHGHGSELQQFIKDDLKTLITKLSPNNMVDDFIISGNTTMEHLLLGYSCEGLGKSPYTPVNIGLQKFGNATILPGISTFVGADIVGGICSLGMDESDEICALIDLGTNGEMAIGNKDKIFVGSTAAGPALEGGNIEFGMAAVPGAISRVDIIGNRAFIKTIDDEKATGICGSGVIETVYALSHSGLMDETGLLDDDYFHDGFPLDGNIIFTQNDIRQVQMAKSAIRAGLETLATEYGVTLSKIKKLYLAGGFGQKINIEKAAGIGMLPSELLDVCIAVGNTSLAGSINSALNQDFQNRMVKVSTSAKEIQLAENKKFNQLYMDNMRFKYK